MNQATRSTVLPWSGQQLMSCLVPTLRQLSWTDFWIDENSQQLTASRRELLAANAALFDLNFRTAITWAEHGDDMEVTVSILEPLETWTEFECTRRLSEIVDCLESQATTRICNRTLSINCSP